MIAVREPSKFLFMSGGFSRVAASKVYRVAAAYIIAAGFIIQDGIGNFSGLGIAELDIPFGGRAPTDRIPITLILAWGFRHHSRRNSSDKGNSSRNAPSSQHDHPCCNRRDRFRSRRFFLLPRASVPKIEKSIAVLRFENLSDEKGENAYFADGIQDDILTNLRKSRFEGDFADVGHVISRQRDAQRRDIGKALGVATLWKAAFAASASGARERAADQCNNARHLGRGLRPRVNRTYSPFKPILPKKLFTRCSEAFAE